MSVDETPADVMPIAVLIDELKHEDVHIRLTATRQLSTIAVALGPERTRDELIPFLTESVDDEDEIILALAEQLGRFVSLVGGPEHAHVLLLPLEMLAAVEESTVREKAVAAMCSVCESLPAEAVRDHMWPLADKFARRDWFTSRAAACGLLPRLFARLPPRAALASSAAASGGAAGRASDGKERMEEDGAAAPGDACRENALALFERLARDDTPMVRRAACGVFADMASAVAGGKLPEALPPAGAGAEGPQEPASAGRGGAGSYATDSKMVEDTGVVAGAGAGAGGSGNSTDGLNVDTGDMSAAAVPPPVPRAITVTASSQEAGARAVTAMLPLLESLSRDEQDSVRLLSVDNCVALARLVNGGMASVTDGSEAGERSLALHLDLRLKLLEISATLASDRAWRVRWSVSNRLSELAAAFGARITTERLLPAFEAMLNDAEAEVRTAAAYRLADIGRLCGKAKISEVLMPCVDRLSLDTSEHVRAALASVILGLAPVLEHGSTIEVLLPLFLRLLKDSSPQVRLNIISKLEAVNAVIGLRVLSQSLLPAIAELSSDKQWRVRLAIIEFMPLLASQLGSDFFASDLTNLCVRWLTDPVFAIREAAAVNLRKLTEVLGPAWAETDILPRIQQLERGGEGLASPETSPYQLRMTSLHAAVTVAAAMPSSSLQPTLLPFILHFGRDPVPNIRFNVAKALEALAPHLEAGAKHGLVKPALETLSGDPEADVRYYAIRALAALG